MQFGWFGHPVYSKDGDYPPIMRELVDKRSKEEGRQRSRLPVFTKAEIEEIRGFKDDVIVAFYYYPNSALLIFVSVFIGTSDYLTMNHYTSRLCTSGIDPTAKVRFQDANFISHIDENWPSCQAVWLKVINNICKRNFLPFQKINCKINENSFPQIHKNKNKKILHIGSTVGF